MLKASGLMKLNAKCDSGLSGAPWKGWIFPIGILHSHLHPQIVNVSHGYSKLTVFFTYSIKA